MYRKKKKKNITQTFICYQVFPSGQLSFSVLINLVSLSIDFFPVSVFEWHNPQGIKFLTRLSVLVSVIFLNINSTIVFKICWINYVTAVLKLNQLHISCSTVPFTTMIGPTSLVLLKKSFNIITNSLFLNGTINFILFTKTFEEALL